MIPKAGSEQKDDDQEEKFAKHEPTWKSRLLLGVNVAFFFSALIGILIGSVAAVLPYKPEEGELHWPVTTMGTKGVLYSFSVVLFSVLGCLAAYYAGPSLKLLFYFYFVFAAILLLAGVMLCITGVHTLSLSLSELLLTNFWFLFPYQWLALPADQAMLEFNDWLHTNGWAVWLTLIVIFIVLIIALVCSVLLLTLENLVGNFLFVFSLGCAAVGLYFTIVQSRLLAVLPAESRTVILVLALIPCILMIIVGFFGVFARGLHKRIFRFMVAAGALAVVSVMLGVLVLCRDKLPELFVSKSSNTSVMQLDDDAWIAISSSLGVHTSWDTKEIFTHVSANQNAMGTALIVVGVFIGVFVLPMSGRAHKRAKEHATSDEESSNDSQDKTHFDSVETMSNGRQDAPRGKEMAVEMTGME